MLGQRTLRVMGFGLAALVGVFALWCGGGDDSSGSGGSSGAGGSGAGTGGSGAGTGGSAGAGGSGTATGGSSGSSGAVNDSGLPATCVTQPASMCAPIAPASATIADFTTPEAGTRVSCSGIEGPNAYGGYGDPLFGGTYVYPNLAMLELPNDGGLCYDQCTVNPMVSMYPLRQDASGGSWHITGTVGDYSGFGFYVSRNLGPAAAEGTFNYAGLPYHTIDASAYVGISFTISGSVGTPSVVFVNMASAATTPMITNDTNHFTTCGTCQLMTGAACGAMEVMVPVTSTPTTQTVSFQSAGITDPGKFMGFSWRFNNPTGIGTGTVGTYPVDVTVDDVKFVTTLP